jgi:hypothetical protein
MHTQGDQAGGIWTRKAQATALLQVSERTIERMCREGHMDKRTLADGSVQVRVTASMLPPEMIQLALSMADRELIELQDRIRRLEAYMDEAVNRLSKVVAAP